MNKFQELDKTYHFNNYGRFPITMSHGKGCSLWDTEGNEYLDGLAGIGVCSLGHSHPDITKTICEQANKIMHVSNFFTTEPNAMLSELICKLSGMDRVFFCNSGAEAIEGAVKIARKYNFMNGRENCEVISLENAFHGRTLATITMGKKKYQEGFGPLPTGFNKANFNDFEDLKSKINDKTGAIIIEPIQGEGGVYVADVEYLKQVRELCDKNNMLLIFDEVQCGVGRAGYLYAFQEYSVKPDILCSAKGIAAGFPMGAVMASQKVANCIEPGNHGTTFGGNPLACAVALTTLQIISNNNFLDEIKDKSQYFISRLNKELSQFKEFVEVRGKGLIIGVQLNIPSRPVVLKMLEKGVIVNSTADSVIRILPPLIISKAEIDRIVEVLIISLKETLTN